MSLPQLAHFGAEPIAERVVIDSNRVTGAGVTSGIDFALTLAARLFREERVRIVQLSMEYDPKPPFDGGSPARSEEHTSELQSLMRISYAVFCLKKKNEKKKTEH